MHVRLHSLHVHVPIPVEYLYVCPTAVYYYGVLNWNVNELEVTEVPTPVLLFFNRELLKKVNLFK